MRLTLALALTLFLARGVSAGELELEESILPPAGADGAAALREHAARCERWKAEAKELAGAAVRYASCGSPEAQRLFTQRAYTVSECFYQGHNYVCGDFTKYEAYPDHGRHATSRGKLLIGFQGVEKQLTEDVIGSEQRCEPAQGSRCLDERNAAIASFDDACRRFKAEAKQSLGARLIYVSCGAPTNELKSTVGNRYRYRATGVIHYAGE